MITGKEKLVPIEKHDVAAGVTGRRDDEHVIIKPHRLVACDDALGTEPGCPIVSVHYSLAAKLLPEQLMVSHIVPVRQKHLFDSTEFLDTFHQLRGKAR